MDEDFGDSGAAKFPNRGHFTATDAYLNSEKGGLYLQSTLMGLEQLKM